MQKPNSSKTIIAVIAILIIAGGAYFYFSGTPTDTGSLITEESSSDAALVGSRVLVLLNQINSLKIDSKFFTSEVYSSLVDHTVPIYEQNVGKSNPFFHPGKAASQ